MLPPELVLTISDYLSAEDYNALRATSRTLNMILERDLWAHVHKTNWRKNPFSTNNSYLVQSFDYRGNCSCAAYFSWMDHSCERRYMSFAANEKIASEMLLRHVKMLTLTSRDENSIGEFGDISLLAAGMPNLRFVELDHWALDKKLLGDILCSDGFAKVQTIKLWNARGNDPEDLQMLTPWQRKLLSSKLKCLTMNLSRDAEEWCSNLSGLLRSVQRLDLDSDSGDFVHVSASTMSQLLAGIDNLNVLRISFTVHNPGGLVYIPQTVTKLSVKSNDMDGEGWNGINVKDLSVDILGNHPGDRNLLKSLKCPNLVRLYVQNFYGHSQSRRIFGAFPRAKVIEFDFTAVVSDWNCVTVPNSTTLESLVIRFFKGDKQKIFRTVIDLADRVANNELPQLKSLFIVLPHSTCDVQQQEWNEDPINSKFQSRLIDLVNENHFHVYLGLPKLSLLSQAGWVKDSGYSHIKDHLNYVHYTKFANHSVFNIVS